MPPSPGYHGWLCLLGALLIQLEGLNFPHGALKVWGGAWASKGSTKELKQLEAASHQQCFPLGCGFHPSRPILFLLRIKSSTDLCEISPSSLRLTSFGQRVADLGSFCHILELCHAISDSSMAGILWVCLEVKGLVAHFPS